ncbi:unnamed protein product [Haemonchus placei]|uniref:Spore coat protein n=1 Tax=Haemonchus placei TaxID=6290 RepID=A0A0N4W4C3_HAEPC|nr:unnamed protein product [Haemonchus placei]
MSENESGPTPIVVEASETSGFEDECMSKTAEQNAPQNEGRNSSSSDPVYEKSSDSQYTAVLERLLITYLQQNLLFYRNQAIADYKSCTTAMTQLIGMYRLALLVLATAYGAVADEEVKENVAAGYFSPVQVDPGYGYDQPTYQQPSYQPPQYYQPPEIVLPPFALPTFDDHRRRGPPGMRRFERQSCRNTAVFSWKSCDTCCKISSRVDEKIPMSSITGALFVFDPDLDFRQNGNLAEDNSNNKAVQCVCCAPKVY